MCFQTWRFRFKFAGSDEFYRMELKELAAVSGKPGLYKVVKPTRTGLILESLDDKKAKIVTGPTQQVSLLSEISIFTTDVDKTIPLLDIFKKINAEFGDDPGVDSKSDKEELYAFLKSIEPEYDPDRVYPSDIKKIVSWYGIILKEAKEVLDEKPEEPKEDSKKDAKKGEVKAEKKKPATKKAAGPKANTGKPKTANPPARKPTTPRKAG